jgi:hypothetical protein
MHVFKSGGRKGETCGRRYRKENEYGLCSAHIVQNKRFNCQHGELRSKCGECTKGGEIDPDYCAHVYRNGNVCGTFLRVRNEYNLCSKHKSDKLYYYCQHNKKRNECEDCSEDEKLRSKLIAKIRSSKKEDLERINALIYNEERSRS